MALQSNFLRAPRLATYLQSAHGVRSHTTTTTSSATSSPTLKSIQHVGGPVAAQRQISRLRNPPKRPRPLVCSHQQYAHYSTYVSRHFTPEPGEIERFLDRHRVRFRCSDTHAVIEECPFCHPTLGKPDNLFKLHVLRTTGVFFCHRCQAKGTLFDLRKQFSSGLTGPLLPGNAVRPRKSSSPVSAPASLERKPAPTRASQESFMQNLWHPDNLTVRDYLKKERGLTDNVLRRYGVGCGRFDIFAGSDVRRNDPCVTFPMYDDNGKLVRHKIRSVETKSGMRLSPKGGAWGIFGLNTVPAEAKSVVLTEGEYDAMSVYQATGRPAISVPNGATSLPLDLLPFLERFDRIYLWMDEDEPGQTGAEQFSRKLGVQRCLSVRGLRVDGKPCKDANEGLQRSIDLEALIKQAQFVQHRALVTFEDIRDQVRADMTNIQNPNAIKCQSLPRFHELLKGLRPGELTILSGPTGSGKTTLLSQLSLDYCVQGVPTLWGSFEVDNARLAGKLLQQFHSVYCKDRSSVIDKFDYWADRFQELPFYFLKYHGSNPVEQVIEAMEFAHYVFDCGHVVLDNLQFMSYGQRGGFHQRQFEIMDHAVGQLREFCTSKKVHVTLVVHPRKTEDDDKIQISSVYGSAKATQEADNVLILQTTNQGRVLDVKKNRFDGSTGGVPLKFDRKRLMFSQGDSCGGWLGWGDDEKAKESKVCNVIAADDSEQLERTIVEKTQMQSSFEQTGGDLQGTVAEQKSFARQSVLATKSSGVQKDTAMMEGLEKQAVEEEGQSNGGDGRDCAGEESKWITRERVDREGPVEKRGRQVQIASSDGGWDGMAN